MYKKVYLLIVAVFVISAIIVPGSNVLAEYPDKPITMLIGFRPGGAVDTTARLVAKNLEKILGQPVVGVTKSGGGGTVMASTLINAKADGYTIGMGASAAYTLTPQINTKIKYTIDDFNHLGTLTIPQDGLVVLKCGRPLDRLVLPRKQEDAEARLAAHLDLRPCSAGRVESGLHERVDEFRVVAPVVPVEDGHDSGPASAVRLLVLGRQPLRQRRARIAAAN